MDSTYNYIEKRVMHSVGYNRPTLNCVYFCLNNTGPNKTSLASGYKTPYSLNLQCKSNPCRRNHAGRNVFASYSSYVDLKFQAFLEKRNIYKNVITLNYLCVVQE